MRRFPASVVSKGLGLEEIVDGAALTADPGSPQEWAYSIERLLTNDELRRNLAIRARQLIEARYNWRVVADRLGKLFASLV